MNVQVAVGKNVRLIEAAKYLQAGGLDGLIAASNGLNNFLESNAVYVLSNVRPIGESAVVLDRDGRSTLIVTPAWDGERAASISSTDQTIGTDDLAAALKDAAAKYRLDMARTISVGLSLARPRSRRAYRRGAGRIAEAGRRTGARSCARAHRRGAARRPSTPPGSPSAATSGFSNLRVRACANTSWRPSFIASPKNSAPRTISF